MQEFLRKLLIYVLFYEYCAFFRELCNFLWIVWLEGYIWGWVCEIAPSRNIRRAECSSKIIKLLSETSHLCVTKNCGKHSSNFFFVGTNIWYQTKVPLWRQNKANVSIIIFLRLSLPHWCGTTIHFLRT
mgnify:CR=1 FL=1